MPRQKNPMDRPVKHELPPFLDMTPEDLARSVWAINICWNQKGS